MPEPYLSYTLETAVPAMNNWMIDWGDRTEAIIAWAFFSDSDKVWHICPVTTSQVVDQDHSPPHKLVPPR